MGNALPHTLLPGIGVLDDVEDGQTGFAKVHRLVLFGRPKAEAFVTRATHLTPTIKERE